ncbi:MAG: kynureninase [Chitinophagaceae bacterium]
MLFEDNLEFAKKSDKKDPLKKFRRKFYFPRYKKKKVIYLCGNSLGLLSKNVKDAIDDELHDWKELAINGYQHAKNPWLYYQHSFKKSLSLIVGCGEEEVTVMNTLTVNLHLLMFSFYRPNSQRYKVLMESGAFPSDQYAVESQVRFHGYEPADAILEIAPREGEKILRHEDILQAIENNRDSIALVLFGGINYYTGQLFNIQSITLAAHAIGAYAGFDLAHAAGNVPLLLHEWNVDFAAWCSYKYLNGGPGAVGGVYIHEKFGNDLQFPRLAGWWGNDEKTRFAMEKGFIPQPGADGWNVSTAQVFNMVCLKASLVLFDRAGIHNLHIKSITLTGYLEFLISLLNNDYCEIISPKDPLQRGAQLSLFFRKNAKEIHTILIKNGVVVDYREPGVIRVAPSPIYNSFEDVYRFYEVLAHASSTYKV